MKKLFYILFFSLISQNTFAKLIFPTESGQYVVPDSSIANPNDAGVTEHTYIVTFKPNALNSHGLPDNGETPASIACIYGLTQFVPGCPIDHTTQIPTGGFGAVAVVDAYHNPNQESDLNVFLAKFGYPPCTTANGCYKEVYASGSRPADDSGWADEHVLDLEWAHAMAPNAKIIMVEAASASTSDLMQAEDVAAQQVLAYGGGEVSNSWGGNERPDETASDSHFQVPGIVYFASSGDYSAPARYPSSSPYVVSAGGTSIVRVNGQFTQEGSWSTNPNVPIGSKSGGSGGPSLYERRPAYQNAIAKIVGNARGTPDFSFDSDPATGVDVYSTNAGGWIRDGGTSVASPALAGIVNAANHRFNSTNDELTYVYTNYVKNYHNYWHDVLSGNNGYPSMPGYDFVTGLGSPMSYSGK